jgi:4-amino-4-deoxy-L-arabinose transferase-like glycosyltransferase/membrane-associated phospholipid phosphatase
MHWFQTLDTALFHFINGGMSNRFFDWLMPVMSGRGVPWLIAVVITVPAIIFLGSLRLRLCALLMVLVVALGDPLVVGTIRQAIARPRPCLALPDVVERLGCTTSGSLPSAHAANWFAMAMVMFLFYRRSAWVMFPLAAAVAFSRVYCGVHYPSDVCIGAILGAGYAIAFVVAVQSVWNLIGKKFFPGWHAQLPDLLKPEPPGHSALRTPHSEIDWLRLGYLVIFLALIGRWFYLASGLINLSEDEAYQWLWSKHLALSYYSKPPGIALIQWAGTSLFGDTEFGVRFFSPVFAAILSVLVLRFMAREAGARAAFILLLITFATPLFVAGSILMTIDPPWVLCSMWAVVAGWRAAQPDGKTRDWLITGLALGLGFLCKYDALFQIICWVIFFALQPSVRIHLRKTGPWLALIVFALCTLPVVVWNSQHGWITVNHVAGDAGMHSAWQPTLNYFFEFTGAEAGLLNPVFFVAALWAMFAAWQRRKEKPLWFFLFCMSAPVFLGHWLFSFHSRVQPNWIAAAVPPMFCLMVAVWNEGKIRVKPWLAAGLLLGIGASVFMYSTDLLGRLASNKLPGDKDPSHRARGWRETALAVETARAGFDTNAFIIVDHYGTTGLYSFYSPPARAAAATSTPLVYCIDSDQPINQFPYWDDYNYRAHRRGGNAIYVVRLDPYPLESGWVWKWLRHERIQYREIPPPLTTPARVAAEFESVTNLGVREIPVHDGRIFQRVQIFGCYHLK